MRAFDRNGRLKVTTGVEQFLFEGSPKVLGDDGLWRWLRSTQISGKAVLYLSQTADTTPGREAIVKDDVDGLYRRVRSTTVDGKQLLYLEDYP